MTTTAPLGVGLLDRIGNTPLLRLERLSRWVPAGVRIYAKAEFTNPGGSVKDRAARNMVLEALKSGELTKDKVLLDATSGNTGIAYAMIGAALGIRVELVMPQNASEKSRIAEAFGAKVIYTDPLEGTDGAQTEAKRLYDADPGRFYLPDQYNNPNNWKAHYKTTAEEIWRQTEGSITHFVAGIGTSGTLMGTGRRLKELNPRIQIVAVEPATPLHGLEGLKHMETSIVPGIYDPAAHDRKVSVFTEDAYEMCCRMAREEGILVGYSCGAAMQGAFEVASGLQEGVVVTVLADSGERYMKTRYWDELLDNFEDFMKDREL
ncbi:MAG: cysteine synthase family protein [Elusimicrobia bacterium]|nr:cysteine synthase family protein [Elusimicrobiota bacterium]MBK7208377.1 cysteine synthase family protein [Elusimicrobiota bacterium]MBK7545137.1 cysteine synthase family protein [Elusimicrobiota bacterium]MBK7574658.1 cysteine synthase family protein [Elusimicrobiota bacterium]MBK7688769.1 cysteine synthase family protein [Elusimicrobiota bacterium]